jgi:hypothetical protein
MNYKGLNTTVRKITACIHQQAAQLHVCGVYAYVFMLELTALEYTQLSLLVYIYMRQLSCVGICNFCDTTQLMYTYVLPSQLKRVCCIRVFIM